MKEDLETLENKVTNKQDLTREGRQAELENRDTDVYFFGILLHTYYISIRLLLLLLLVFI